VPQVQRVAGGGPGLSYRRMTWCRPRRKNVVDRSCHTGFGSVREAGSLGDGSGMGSGSGCGGGCVRARGGFEAPTTLFRIEVVSRRSVNRNSRPACVGLVVARRSGFWIGIDETVVAGVCVVVSDRVAEFPRGANGL